MFNKDEAYGTVHGLGMVKFSQDGKFFNVKYEEVNVDGSPVIVENVKEKEEPVKPKFKRQTRKPKANK